MEMNDRYFAVGLTGGILALTLAAVEIPGATPGDLGLVAAALTMIACVVASLLGLEGESAPEPNPGGVIAVGENVGSLPFNVVSQRGDQR